MSERNRRFMMLLLAGLMVAAAGCPENSLLDDEDSAPVVLEIQVLTSPGVTAAPDTVAGCLSPIFTVTEWSATAGNLPKTSGAISSPFNDIDLRDVTITYTCDAGLTCPPTRLFGLTGTVPANGSVGFTYPPIFLQDVNTTLEGTTLNLDMVFRAETISGESITYVSAAVLQIASCL